MELEGQHRFDELLAIETFCQDPYPVYQQLLENAPVLWSESWNAWVISSYDEVVASLRNTAHFSSAGRMPLLTQGLTADTRHQMTVLEHHFALGLIHTDPPNHTRLRGLVNKAFTSRAVERIRQQIEDLVNELLDGVQGSGRMEILSDFAYPLPTTVIALMLGVPPDDRERFKHWSDDIIALQESNLNAAMVLRARHSIEEMKAYLGTLLEERRAAPGNDLLSRLAGAEDQGQLLTTDELLATCVTLLIAGHETTTSLITSGLLTLLQHPDQLALLRADPDLMDSAIEEMLRFESPIQRDFRRVAADIEVHGQNLEAGSLVFQMLGAANRDPGHFVEPDRFDITRTKNRHLAFGYGIHFCVGAPLARLEAPITLRVVLERMPALALDEESIVWQDKRSFRCPRQVSVRF